MSAFGDLEQAVTGALTAMTNGAAPLFGTVEGSALLHRRDQAERVERMAMPAALVIVAARTASATVPGPLRIHVLLADRSLRSAAQARGGAGATGGAYALSHRVLTELGGAVLLGTHRLDLLDEQIAWADARQVVIEQRYRAERATDLMLPTYGNVAITGGQARVSVTVDGPRPRSATYGFPGVAAQFQHVLGWTPRQITWTGRLRAEDDAALNAIERDIEALHGDGQGRALVDGLGRSHDGCTLDAFERLGPRLTDAGSLARVQPFRMTFTQWGG